MQMIQSQGRVNPKLWKAPKKQSVRNHYPKPPKTPEKEMSADKLGCWAIHYRKLDEPTVMAYDETVEKGWCPCVCKDI